MTGHSTRKTVLFIAPKFYAYHQKIIKSLEEMHFKVIFFENKFFREDPALNNNDLISQVKRWKNPNYKSDYQHHIRSHVKDLSLDLLFCIGGFSISADFIETLQRDHPNLHTVAYFWDSFDVWDYRHLIKSFDEIYTFDRLDAEKYHIQYLPLFYYFDDISAVPYQERTIDLLFVGSLGYHSINRLKVLAYLERFSVKHGLNSFFWLYFPQVESSFIKKALNWIRRKIPGRYSHLLKQVKYYKGSSHHFIKHETIDSDTLPLLIKQARCIIDVPVPGQVGLTMRTIETLASGVKLITTNQSIKKESFYSPDFIYLIEEDHPEISIDFLQFYPVGKIDIGHLQIKNWLAKLLDISAS